MNQPPDKDLPTSPSRRQQREAVVATGISFSGPLPPPSVLEGYDRIVPGAAERLLSLVEADAKHQRELEFAALNAEVRGVRLGQVLGCLVVLAALTVAAFCVAYGQETAASTIGGTTVVSLAACFVLGRRKETPPKPTRKKR